jgi:uncharacterized 2Fe-2S/4Fe-4S cluster protein (DUF4445 family)
MQEADIKFEREGKEGIVPVGSYLSDAARRLGVRFEEKCEPAAGIHFCRVTVADGEEVLSERTQAERELTESDGATPTDRLACQARIERVGEIVIMTRETENKAAEDEPAVSEKYVKEFSELPLEKKIAELAHLEAIALGETVSFVLNSPYLIFDKVIDVMAAFGMRKEAEVKQAVRPPEHAPSTNGDGGTAADGGEVNSAEGQGSSEEAEGRPAGA